MRKVSEDYIGTCQACFGEFKVGDDRRMVVHGFRRPGHGHILGECRGTDHAPFEHEHVLSSKILSEERDHLQYLGKRLADLKEGKITSLYVLVSRNGSERSKQITASDRAWAKTLKAEISKCSGNISISKMRIKFFETKIQGWSKGNVVGLDVPPTGHLRGLKPAYDPAREKEEKRLEAKRAERAGRPGKIRIKLIWYGLRATESYQMSDAEKKAVKAWVKTIFKKGKNRVCEGYSLDLPGHMQKVVDHKVAWKKVIIIHADWSYKDQIASMIPNLTRYDNNLKEIDFYGDVTDNKPWGLPLKVKMAKGG